MSLRDSRTTSPQGFLPELYNNCIPSAIMHLGLCYLPYTVCCCFRYAHREISVRIEVAAAAPLVTVSTAITLHTSSRNDDNKNTVCVCVCPMRKKRERKRGENNKCACSNKREREWARRSSFVGLNQREAPSLSTPPLITISGVVALLLPPLKINLLLLIEFFLYIF